MAQQSTRTSGNQAGNLGVAPISFDPADIAFGLLVPKDTLIDAAARADIRSFLKTRAQAPVKADRFQPTPRIVSAEPQGSDAVKESAPAGFERIIRESGYAFMFAFWKGGKTYHSKLRTFNGLQDLYDLLLVDSNNVLMGTSAVDANGAWAMKGYSLAQIFTDSYKFNDASKGSEVKMFVSLASSAEFNDKFEFIELDFNFGSDIKGVVDVALHHVGTTAPGATLTLAPMAGGENLVARFPTVLNALTAWVHTRQDTGATLATTAVSAISAVGFRITPDLSGVPSDTLIRTSLAPMTTLSGLGLKGYESNAYEWRAP